MGPFGRLPRLDIARQSFDTGPASATARRKGPESVRRTPLISLTAATGLLEAIEAAGANPEQTPRSVGLTPAAVSKPDGFIPCAQFARLLDEAAHATGDDCFGLHFGERFNPKDAGPVAYVMINSPTIQAGFQDAARY